MSGASGGLSPSVPLDASSDNSGISSSVSQDDHLSANVKAFPNVSAESLSLP